MTSRVTTSGIYEFKARVSEFIGRVQRGGEILVTKNRQPVARLVPVGPQADNNNEKEPQT